MSEGMNPWLATVYNTHGAAEVAAEEQQKIAHGEMFAKLAAEHGIDLSVMSDEEIQDLHERVYSGLNKTAAPTPEAPAPEPTPEPAPQATPDPEIAKAAEYHSEKVAFQEKFAEADLMGRVMAHAFTQELELIKRAAEEEKKDDKPEEKPEEKKDEKKEEGDKPEAKSLPPWLQKKDGEKKEGSANFEQLAMQRAVEIAKVAEFDADVAAMRVNAVATLGLQESVKIAHVKDTEAALHIRGLEYLEAAGYPVNWEQVFGK